MTNYKGLKWINSIENLTGRIKKFRHGRHTIQAVTSACIWDVLRIDNMVFLIYWCPLSFVCYLYYPKQIRPFIKKYFDFNLSWLAEVVGIVFN